MTAVPDRFRDQLAEALSEDVIVPVERGPILDALLPVIAAEVEARVQAAANQRAAEELRAAANDLNGPLLRPQAVWLRTRADALTQPADGTGQP